MLRLNLTYHLHTTKQSLLSHLKAVLCQSLGQHACDHHLSRAIPLEMYFVLLHCFSDEVVFRPTPTQHGRTDHDTQLVIIGSLHSMPNSVIRPLKAFTLCTASDAAEYSDSAAERATVDGNLLLTRGANHTLVQHLPVHKQSCQAPTSQDARVLQRHDSGPSVLATRPALSNGKQAHHLRASVRLTTFLLPTRSTNDDLWP